MPFSFYDTEILKFLTFSVCMQTQKTQHKVILTDWIYVFFSVCLMSEGNEMNAENGSSVLMVGLEFLLAL